MSRSLAIASNSQRALCWERNGACAASTQKSDPVSGNSPSPQSALVSISPATAASSSQPVASARSAGMAHQMAQNRSPSLSMWWMTCPQDWLLWTPEGTRMSLPPVSMTLSAWHVNRWPDEAADFYPVENFKSTFHKPIAHPVRLLRYLTRLTISGKHSLWSQRPLQ